MNFKEGLRFGVIDCLPRLGYRIHIEGKENLAVFDNKNLLPAVVGTNHVGFDDPYLWMLVLDLLKIRQKNFILPYSETHAAINTPLSIYPKAVAIGQALGYCMPAVIQPYLLRDDSLGEEEKKRLIEKSRVLDEDLLKIVNKELLERGIFILAPEGHRSELKNHSLQPAEDGLGFLIKKMIRLKEQKKIQEGLSLPIALSYSHGHRGINWRPGIPRGVEIKIGKPLTLEDIQARAQQLEKQFSLTKIGKSALYSHTFMLAVAELLPPEMQGVYGPDLIGRTLAGQLVLKPRPKDQKGKVKVEVYDTESKEFI